MTDVKYTPEMWDAVDHKELCWKQYCRDMSDVNFKRLADAVWRESQLWWEAFDRKHNRK